MAKQPIVVVTGLPRSGTSMMMQMLCAGGLPAYHDETRQADTNNPKGYYEHERVKRLRTDSAWIAEAQGHCIKIIHALLDVLPAGEHYKIIFMRRAVSEVMRSQQAMIANLRTQASTLGTDELGEIFERQIAARLAWLQEQPSCEVLIVDYPAVIAEPHAQAQAVATFLMPDFALNTAAMADAVDPSLYRQRD